MQLYVAWIPSFCQDAGAVSALKESEDIDGVECYGHSEELEMVKAAGLGLSVHNPLRIFKIGIQDEEFASVVPHLQRLCSYSDAPVVGLHLACERSQWYSPEQATRHCVKHLALASQSFGPRVAFETTMYCPGKRRHQVEAPFLAQLLQETDAGFVFDTSHTYISAVNVAAETGQDPEALLRDVVAAVRGRVVQLHFNVPGIVDGKIWDTHGIYVPGEERSERMIALAKEILAENPVELVTLEMYAHKEPAHHARIMVEQARLVSERLGITKQLPAP